MTSYSESTIQAKINKTELATLGAKLFNVDCKVFKDWSEINEQQSLPMF